MLSGSRGAVEALGDGHMAVNGIMDEGKHLQM